MKKQILITIFYLLSFVWGWAIRTVTGVHPKDRVFLDVNFGNERFLPKRTWGNSPGPINRVLNFDILLRIYNKNLNNNM